MSFFAICTFDLQNASREDYQNAYADLAKIGFSTSVTADNGIKVTLPTTMTAGVFTGQSVSSVRTELIDRVQSSFNTRKFKYEIFISVCNDWAWAHRTNK
jgi:hypothetical protein